MESPLCITSGGACGSRRQDAVAAQVRRCSRAIEDSLGGFTEHPGEVLADLVGQVANGSIILTHDSGEADRQIALPARLEG